MKYKVGDRVKVKSIQWFNENFDDNYNVVVVNGWHFSEPMSIFCGKELIIERISHATNPPHYIMKDNIFAWTDEMIEGLVEDENNHLTETVVDTVRESNDRYRIVIDPRFDIEVDEGEYYAVRRKKEYPKTYEECCKVLGIDSTINHTIGTHFRYRNRIMSFIKLLICRDAYWKIAGEDMGLGKPWEPDWTIESSKYIILFKETKIEKHVTCKYSRVLAFPTEEMRDAFYENFKELIEQCKELL